MTAIRSIVHVGRGPLVMLKPIWIVDCDAQLDAADQGQLRRATASTSDHEHDADRRQH